jgi:RNA polymerase sigma factor (sigma-70 family)
MPDVLTDNVLQHVRSLACRQTAGRESDGSLLRAFAEGQDQSAFTALVKRHGPLVLAVCGRVLHNLHDAEDAFQATFILLARNVSAIRKPESLSSWLHGVAYRTARSAKRAAVRRRRHEAEVVAMPRTSPERDLAWHEVQALLDEEVQRLPEIYRAAFILCCLEEKSGAEAAASLDIKEATVRTRVAKARALLREAFARRGVSLAAALAAAALAEGATRAALPGALVAATVRAAAANPEATVLPAGVAALVQGGETMIPLVRKSSTALLLLTLAVAGAGIGLCAYPQAGPPPPKESAAQEAKSSAGPARPLPAFDRADPAKGEVSGRVLDPNGKPLAGSRLYLGYVSSRGFGFHRKGWSRRGKDGDLPLGDTVWPLPVRAASGKDGSFRFSITGADLDVRLMEEQSALPAVIAVAGGKGPCWAPLGKPGASLTLRLVPDDVPIVGRILDEDGKPVRDVKVRVVCVVEKGGSPAPWAGPLPGQSQTVKTGADGRFRLAGLGNDREVILGLEGATIEHRQISARTSKARPGETTAGKHHGLPATFTYVASAGRLIRGVVRDRATGKPVAGVRVKSHDGFVEAPTDKEGRYELPGNAKKQWTMVTAWPESGQPYFSACARVEDTPGLAPLTANFNLVGGIALRGQVKEKATGRKPAAAIVQYFPLYGNPHTRTIAPHDCPASSAVVAADGSYRLVVLPGPGVVCVSAAPRDAYAPGLVTGKELAALFNDTKHHGSDRWLLISFFDENSQGVISQERFNALALLNPAEKSTALTRDLELSPARTVRGTVVGPDGKALAGVTVTGLTHDLDYPETLQTASFVVKRLTPGRSRKLVFHHREKALAAGLTIRGDEKGPLTVRLGPCGSVTGRLLDKDNKPVARAEVQVGSAGSRGRERKVETDQQGRFRMDGLVPGEQYRVMGRAGSSRWWKHFTAKGKENELGDLTLLQEEE